MFKQLHSFLRKWVRIKTMAASEQTTQTSLNGGVAEPGSEMSGLALLLLRLDPHTPFEEIYCRAKEEGFVE